MNLNIIDFFGKWLQLYKMTYLPKSNRLSGGLFEHKVVLK